LCASISPTNESWSALIDGLKPPGAGFRCRLPGNPGAAREGRLLGRYLPVNSTRLGEDLIEKGIADVKAVPAVQIENDRVIVTEWTFAPGAETGQHIHTFEYVVVPLTSGTLRLVEPEGPRDAQLTAGVSYTRPAGVNHNVINLNTHEFRFLEIELK